MKTDFYTKAVLTVIAVCLCSITFQNTDIDKIDIYNQLGQLVLSVRDSKTVDMTSLAKGIYMMKLSNRLGSIYSEKIIRK